MVEMRASRALFILIAFSCTHVGDTEQKMGSGVTVALRGAAPPLGGDDSAGIGAWEHDVEYFVNNVRSGVPGLQREIHDTVWNVSHLNSQTADANIFRGLVWIVIIYLGLGAAINHYKEGARGVEMIPHCAFWCASAMMLCKGLMFAKTSLSKYAAGSKWEASGVSVPQRSSLDSFGTFEMAPVPQIL